MTRMEPAEGSQPATKVGRADRLGLLYEAEAARATRLAYVLTNDAQEAQDIAHEAFVRVGRKIFGLKDPDHARAYLLRTVLNLCRGRARRLKTQHAAEHKLRPDTIQTPAEPAQGHEMWAYLLELPARQRAALFLRYYQDLSETQAAEALD